MIDPLRIAVIGAGGMGREHMRQISLAPDADLIAVSDVDFDAAQRAADEFGARAVVGLVDRLADTGLDGVVVASTDETHADITLAALGAGVPVLCEKPLAHTVAAARQVVDAEVGLGRRLVQVGFMRVYDPAHVELAEAIADLGPVHYVRCVHRNRQPVVRPAATVLVQSVIHDVHTVRWLAGAEIVEVSTIARPRAGGVRYIHVTARLASGGIATIEFDDLSYAYEVAVEVTAEMGIVTTAGPIARSSAQRAPSVLPLVTTGSDGSSRRIATRCVRGWTESGQDIQSSVRTCGMDLSHKRSWPPPCVRSRRDAPARSIFRPGRRSTPARDAVAAQTVRMIFPVALRFSSMASAAGASSSGKVAETCGSILPDPTQSNSTSKLARF